MSWRAVVQYLCRLVICSWMEGEYSSKVEAGLWVPYDIKIVFLSLRYHTSLFSSDMFAHSRLILDEYTSVQRTAQQKQTHRSALQCRETNSAVV